jgi:hypothetical protein
MNMTIRNAALAVAFAATVAAAFTATSFRGETKEMSLADSCSRAAWPMIPAACLDGASNEAVRYVSADPAPQARALEDRFATAFE